MWRYRFCLDAVASVAAIHHCGFAALRPVPEVLGGATPGLPIKCGGAARLRAEATPVRRTGLPGVATSAASHDSGGCP
jgi:hypothetical protein